MGCCLLQLGQGSLFDVVFRDGLYCDFLHAKSWMGKCSEPDCAPRRRGG